MKVVGPLWFDPRRARRLACSLLATMLTVAAIVYVGPVAVESASPSQSIPQHQHASAAENAAAALVGDRVIESGKLSKAILMVDRDGLKTALSPSALKLASFDSVWVLAYEDVVFPSLASDSNVEECTFKHLLVIVDALSGQLVEIRMSKRDSIDSRNEAGIPLSPLKEEFRGRAEDAVLSFDDALSKCRGLPLQADRIVAVLVQYVSVNATLRPAWVIYMDGLPPWTPPSGAEFVIRNQRTVVDALTGEVLYSAKYVPNDTSASE